jgi:PTS system nitrogen regulatory IIA component
MCKGFAVFLQKEFYLMEDDILTIDEVAKYLRVSERTVYDWAQKREIPSGKIGTVWRFKKSEIEKWVNDRLSSGTKTPLSGNKLQIKNILSPDRIVFLNHSTKHDALLELSDILSTAPQVKYRQELSVEILKREELMSTAMGRGIAIPHVRLSSVTDLVMAVGISQCDIIDFQTIDDTPVRLLFMIAAAYNQHSYYLQTLSFISTKMKDADLRNALLNIKKPIDAYNLLIKED